MLSVLAPLGISSNRADALLIIEHRQPSTTVAPIAQPAGQPAPLIPPTAKPATAGTTIGTPVGSATSVSRGRY
jgi:hypothetical protein